MRTKKDDNNKTYLIITFFILLTAFFFFSGFTADSDGGDTLILLEIKIWLLSYMMKTEQLKVWRLI